jgi:hypothetical protein
MEHVLDAPNCTFFSSTIRRVAVRTGLSYKRLVAGFETEVGRWDVSRGAKLVAEQASWAEAQTTISAMAGARGLMVFARIDQGEIASLPDRCADVAYISSAIRLTPPTFLRSTFVPACLCHSGSNYTRTTLKAFYPTTFLRLFSHRSTKPNCTILA